MDNLIFENVAIFSRIHLNENSQVFSQLFLRTSQGTFTYQYRWFIRVRSIVTFTSLSCQVRELVREPTNNVSYIRDSIRLEK